MTAPAAAELEVAFGDAGPRAAVLWLVLAAEVRAEPAAVELVVAFDDAEPREVELCPVTVAEPRAAPDVELVVAFGGVAVGFVAEPVGLQAAMAAAGQEVGKLYFLLGLEELYHPGRCNQVLIGPWLAQGSC